MSSVQAVPVADLELLRQFDTPTVCNVVELFDVHPRNTGYMDARIRACYPNLPPMVGYASTATFRSAFPPRSGDVYSGIGAQVESFAKLPGPPVVVFQDLDNPVASATFGEVMCTTYQTFGAAGLITSGAGRDIEQVAELDFPCFCDGFICAHGYCHIVQIDVPIHVGGVAIAPGELLHGDLNGVTTIPNGIASAVAHACPELVAAEAIVLDYLKAGKVEASEYAERRNESQNRIRQLGQKLKSNMK